MKTIPILVFGDKTQSVVDRAKAIGLGEEWVTGDPMNARLDAIVSPANTVADMSGGYDLVIRNRLGTQVEDIARNSVDRTPIFLGQARVVDTKNTLIPHMIIVPTVVGALAGGNSEVGSLQSRTPSEDVIERGTYNFMMAAYQSGLNRVGSVLLGGGVGGVNKEIALKAMLVGYLKAYDQIDELIYGQR